MPTTVIPTAVLVAVLGLGAAAQPPRVDELKLLNKADRIGGTGGKSELPMFELRTDDTVMKVGLVDTELTITTKYGKLTVPAGDVRRLECGFRYPDGLEAKIQKAVSELGAQEFRTREDAEQVLAGAGRYALPALRRARRSEDPETARRASGVLRLLEGKLAPEQRELRDYDTVETAEFTAKGRLETGTLRVRAKLFGETTVRLADVRAFQSVGSGANAEFALDAAKYARPNRSEWMETSVELNAGQHLEVIVTGRVDQWPQQPGQYMCGPEGTEGMLAQPGAQPRRQGAPGQVIGRIGPNGTPFVVGAAHKGRTTESGKLYLRIEPSPWNCESVGAYKITAAAVSP